MPRIPADWRFVCAHPAHFIAFGFGSGLAPVAPGTFGSLVGIPLALWLLPAYGDLGFGLIIAGAFLIGVWACDLTGKRLGVTDYGGLVWDEVVAMMLILWFVPLRPWWILGAFLLFRLFDIIKLPPARQIDAHWKSGLGVMLDDIAAAVHTLIALAVLKRILALA